MLINYLEQLNWRVYIFYKLVKLKNFHQLNLVFVVLLNTFKTIDNEI